VDIEEAYAVGCFAVDMAIQDGTGYMATILRAKEQAYRAVYTKVALRTVANSERHLPKSWISPDGIDVTDEFIRYAQPLLGDGWPEIPIENGLQRFARLNQQLVEKRVKPYIPFKHRGID
jgi:6-phosphofructokinase 1